MTIDLARPEINTTPPAYHGALDYAELEQLGLHPDQVSDFSVNSNPFGPSPAVRRALQTVPPDRYPDREAIALRRALAEHLGIPSANIVVGNGGAELLWMVSFTFLQRHDPVLVIGPTFGEYSRTAALMGAMVHTWQAAAEDNFEVNPAAVAQELDRLQPRLVFVCNPNNPTGHLLSPDTIGGWAAAYPRTLFAVDEAYLAFADGAASVLALGLDNLLAVRSMTKDYALAGLRLGYAASTNPALITALQQVRPAWNVSAPAQAAGLAALNDQPYLQQCVTDVTAAGKNLQERLRSLGFQPVPSTTHFFVMPVGNGNLLRHTLLKQGLLVRDCASFGLPDYVRIAARQPADNQRLLDTLKELIILGEIAADGEMRQIKRKT